MKYDIVLCPDLKKNWVHYDVEIHKSQEKKNWKNYIARYRSTSYAGWVDYPAFRPDSEIDLAEAFNEKLDLKPIVTRNFYTLEKIKDLEKNIDSVVVKNPVYYCLKSKLVWQNKEYDEENPPFSDKLIEIKEYKRGSDVNVTECQIDSKINYDEGGSIEITRKTIKRLKERYQRVLNEEIKMKDFKDHCYYEMFLLMDQELD